MSQLWTPPHVRRDLMDSTNEHVAALRDAALRDATCDFWDRELKKLDSALYMVKAHDDAEVPGLKPGFWHVIRDCSPAPPAILPIVGDDGEYVEPTSRLLDVLRAGDLQSRRAMEDRAKIDEARARSREREEQSAHEDRVTEMIDRVKSLTQTRVSMTDVPWTQNVQGRRGAKKT